MCKNIGVLKYFQIVSYNTLPCEHLQNYHLQMTNAPNVYVRSHINDNKKKRLVLTYSIEHLERTARIPKRNH